MQNRTNFNYIAPFYDTLCQLVFGQRVKNAQIESLKFIPANSTILIAGGGTGWIPPLVACRTYRRKRGRLSEARL